MESVEEICDHMDNQQGEVMVEGPLLTLESTT